MAEEKAKKVPEADANTQGEADALRARMEAERAEREADKAKLDEARKAAGLDAKAGIVQAGSAVKREQLKQNEGLPAEAPAVAPKVAPQAAPERKQEEVPVMGEFNEAEKSDFVKQIDDGSVGRSINKMALNIDREDTKINAQQWHEKATSPEGLKEVYNNFLELKIVDSNPPFFKKMFAVLENGANPANPYRSGRPENTKLFLDPINNMREISALPPATGFVGGEVYAKAFAQLHAIQAIVVNQDKMQLATASMQEKQDKDSLANGAVDFIKDNVNTFREAIRNRDYATAGLYAVGVWAIYKSYMKLTDGKDGLKTKLIYAAAAYCGYEFAKNAGYDILKMAGVKDADYDVKGTPMAIMQKILNKNPKLKEDTKDLDYYVVAKMADVNLKSLDDLYLKNNDPDVHFIDPAQFPGLFPAEVLNARPTNLGLSGDLKSDQGMVGMKLNSDQREYIRLGQQIYKLAVAMRGIYDETLRKDEKQRDFFGIPYEQALRDGNHSVAKVRHMMAALDDYAGRTPGESIFGKKHIEKVREDMDKAFKGKPDIGLWIRDRIRDGHFEGRLKGMPVVFVMSENGESYKVYLKNKYGGEVPGPGYMAEIPVAEGAARDREVDKAETNVNARMAELLGSVAGNGGRYSAPRYEAGKWVADVTLPGMARFNIQATPMRVFVDVNKDGKGITITDTTGNVQIGLDEEVGKQYPLGISLAPRITAQENFKALRILSAAGEFKVRGVDEAKGTVQVTLGKSNIPVEFAFDQAANKFSLDPAKETELMKNPVFASELTRALTENENFELNKNLKELKELIEGSCSEGFVKYFFKSLVGGTNESPLDGVNLDSFTGSIPEGFTNMVIDTSRTEVMERFRRAVSKAGNLAELEKQREFVLQDFNDELKNTLARLKASNTELRKKGENWDRDRFMSEVVGRIRGASSESTAYTLARSDFEYLVYGLKLPGLLTAKSDFGDESHNAASRLMGVFSFYTAHLDNPTFNYASGAQKIELDHLKWPATPTPGITDHTQDPALEGHYINQYIEDVKGTIIGKASASGDLSNVPNGSASGFWQIPEYEDWKRANPTRFEALDPMDNKPPYSHDVELHAGDPAKFTELDKAMKDKFMKAVDLLKDEYGEILDYAAIEDYFRNKVVIPGKRPIGLLVPFEVTNDGNVVERKCALWEMTGRIASASTKRSDQVKLMDIEVSKFVRMIFEEPGVPPRAKRFFTELPSWSTKLVMKWPWLRHVLPND